MPVSLRIGRKIAMTTAVFIFLASLHQNVGAEEKPAALTILALGDSTTAGSPAFHSPLEHPPDGAGDPKSQYIYWITQRHPQWTLLNRGIAGQRSDQILERFKKELDEEAKPDVVIVLAGVNDLYQGSPSERVKFILTEIYDLALEKNVRVMACTILPYNRSTEEVKKKITEINDWIRAYSREHGFLFCDTFAVLNDPGHPGNLTSSPDAIHPDAAGYRKMGEAIAKVLDGDYGAR